MVSYSDILARNHANDFRRVVNDPLYRATFPAMRLDRDTDREIATTKRGKRIATSIDGTLTGLGGNLIIIDDPLKFGDAMSEAVRARVIEWYRSTLLSRGDDKTTTRIVVVMQRVHQKTFGLVVGSGNKGAFAQRARMLAQDHPVLSALIDKLIEVREVAVAKVAALDKEIRRFVRNDLTLRRFMTVPGVGPVTALAFAPRSMSRTGSSGLGIAIFRNAR